MPSTEQLAGSPATFTPEAVDQQLARVLASHHFCHSVRYPALLRYLVQQAQTGSTAGLKERSLGIEVFHRAPDYDTNTDPVVRVTAAEVRKRIAQYYQEPEHFGELRIDLPLGSYVPRFLPPWQSHPSNASVAPTGSGALPPAHSLTPSWSELAPEPSSLDATHSPGHGAAPLSVTTPPDALMLSAREASLAELPAPGSLTGEAAAASEAIVPAIALATTAPKTAGFFKRWATPLLVASALLIGAALAAAGFLVSGWTDSARSRGLHQLWEPVTANSESLLFVVGDHSLDDQGQSLGIAPNYQSMTDTVLTQMNHRSQVPLNDLISLDRIHAFLTRHRHAYRDAGAGEANLGDLRSGPVVLFAGFDNRWSVQLSQHLRFQLLPNVTDSISTIVDSQNSSRRWSVDFEQSLNHFVSDYGIVARYFDPLLEQNVLLVAGIGEMGTASASEFVTEERFAREIMRAAPRGWNNGNFEIVFNTPVVDGHPGPPRIIASAYW